MEAVSGEGACALDVPLSSSEGVESEFLNNFWDAHDAHILFVGEDE